MPRNPRKVKWVPIDLKPIEEQSSAPARNLEEPEHFKYGIFYNDGYDYMQHLRSGNEMYTVVLADDDVVKDEFQEQETIVPIHLKNDQVLPPEIDVPSDDEFIDDLSEIEDDFVALASKGGSMPFEKPEKDPMDGLTGNKAIMMERFLYGNNQEGGRNLDAFFNDSDEEGHSTIMSSSRKGRMLTDEEIILEQQFKSTLMRTTNRNNVPGNSVISGASIMSEALSACTNRDFEIRKKSRIPNEAIEELHRGISDKTRELISGIPEDGPSEQIQEDTTWTRASRCRDDISSIASSSVNKFRSPRTLEMPSKNQKRKSQKSNSSSETEENDEQEGMEVDDKPVVQLVHERRKPNETAEEKRERKGKLKEAKRARLQQRKLNRQVFSNTSLPQNLKQSVEIKIDV